MNRTDLIAFLCVVAMYVGFGAAFLIDGMGWASFAGTVPSWVFIGAHYLGKRKRRKIIDSTREWFV